MKRELLELLVQGLLDDVDSFEKTESVKKGSAYIKLHKYLSINK